MENGKTLKITLFISILALIISIVNIFVLPSDSKDVIEKGENIENKEVENIEISSEVAELGIAYIDLDTLLLNYKFSIKLNEDLLTEQAKSRANLEKQIRQFEKEYNSFMEKAQLGSFISQASMEAQQQELIEKQQRLERLDRELSENLMLKQSEMNAQLYDTIMVYMKEFNKGQYNLILGNASGAAVLYGKPGMNITQQVIDALNERYDRRMSN